MPEERTTINCIPPSVWPVTEHTGNSCQLGEKKMNKYLFLLAPLFLLWSCGPAGPTDEAATAAGALTEFVALDRAYIPPLYFTSVEDLEASRASFARLKEAWKTFRAAAADIFDDPEWSGELATLEQQVEKAGAIIAEGQDLKAAHEELEHLREVLLTARRRNAFDYYVDYLTAYHEPMEGIVLTAKETPPEQWTEATTARIREYLPEAEALWAAVREAAFEPSAYDFDEQRQQKMQQFLAAETEALQQLKTALDGQVPAAQLRAAAMRIKPPFAGLFQLFGAVEVYRGE